jgi:NAD(P)H-dependent FMN reductase
MITGSTRSHSTNTALCRSAAEAPPAGVEVACFADLASLPHFDPDADVEPLPAPVARLRAAVASADAVVFCTPEYAGTLPGSFKNALDWLVGGMEIQAKRVAWINASPDATRGRGALDALEVVLGYVGADVVRDACRHVPVYRAAVGEDGLIADPSVRSALDDALRAVLAT